MLAVLGWCVKVLCMLGLLVCWGAQYVKVLVLGDRVLGMFGGLVC